MKYLHYPEIDMILDKAEMLYIESFTHDLERLKNEDKIATINFEEIRQFIEEMNWKFTYNR